MSFHLAEPDCWYLKIAKSTAPNYDIFSDFATASYVEYGGVRFSDSGGRWNDPEGMQGVIRKIESSLPGDRIEILVHPDWWGKQ